MYKFIKGWAKVVVACTFAAPPYALGLVKAFSTGNVDRCCESLIKNFESWVKRVDPAVKELEDVHLR